MSARKRPYLPILDRSLELFARLRPPSWIFKMSRLASRLLHRSRRSIPPMSMGLTFKTVRIEQLNMRLTNTPKKIVKTRKFKNGILLLILEYNVVPHLLLLANKYSIHLRLSQHVYICYF